MDSRTLCRLSNRLGPTLIAMVAALLLSPASAQATEPHEGAALRTQHAGPTDIGEPEHHGSHRSNLFGAKTGPMLMLEPAHAAPEHLATIPAGFVGVFFERTLVPGWLEVEITVPLAMARIEEETVLFIPLDIHFKKPFHPLPWLAPYIGAGPALDIFIHDPKVFIGASFTAGTYVWPGHGDVGIDIEADYNVLAFQGSAAHEVLVAAGPVWRF